jgi:OOP family OmpA-OmpF porin
MRKTLITLAAMALGLTVLPAQAADNGIYLGAGIGQAGIDIDDFNYDADATSYKLIAGWRFLDWLAVEANYLDFGSGDDTVDGIRLESDADGVSLSAVGFLPVGPVDLFARVGAVDWSADLSADGLGSVSDDGTDLTYGVGAQFRVWSLSIRAEYEVFDIEDVDVDMISLGLTWTFL